MKSFVCGAVFWSLLVFSCTSTKSVVDTSVEKEEVEPADPCEGVECGEAGTCTTTAGEAACECDDGYVDESLSCVDVDECVTDNGGCGPDYRYLCENNEGAAPTCTDKCSDLGASIEALSEPASHPVMSGTVWFHKDIITDDDPSAFLGVTYSGQGERLMFDRRTNDWETLQAHLFDARFAGDVTVEVQVNPEFNQEEAETESRFYAEYIGKLPAFLFRDIQTVWIHQGVELYGGGNQNLLIHTGQTPEYLRDEVLEEVFIHEAAHTSMDAYYAADPSWLAAQQGDGMAISSYALEFPDREDVAETLGPYLAYRHRPERLNELQISQLEETIPNRILFFDCLELQMDPLQ